MSKIEWTDKTWNVITGCTQISEACKNCYAKEMTKRLQGMTNSHFKKQFPKDSVLRFNDDGSINDLVFKGKYRALYPPSKAKLKYIQGWDNVVFHTDMLGHIFNFHKYPSGCKVFVNSMSDTFHNDVSYSHLKMLFNTMGARSDVTFQVLTKRYTRMYNFLTEFHELLTSNIWIGVTAENQKMVKERVACLVCLKKEIKRFENKDITIFVSCEPLLGSIDLSKYINDLDWVIVGGERAHKKGRVMEYKWVEDIYLQCRKTDTPFFFKQWGDGEAKVRVKGDDINLCEVIESKKEFPDSQSKKSHNPSLHTKSNTTADNQAP